MVPKPTILLNQSATWDLLIICGIILLALAVLFLVVIFLRRRFDPRRGEDEAQQQSSRLEQAEALRDAGQISDEEFQAIRRVILGLPPKRPEAVPEASADGASPGEAPQKPHADSSGENIMDDGSDTGENPPEPKNQE